MQCTVHGVPKQNNMTLGVCEVVRVRSSRVEVYCSYHVTHVTIHTISINPAESGDTVRQYALSDCFSMCTDYNGIERHGKSSFAGFHKFQRVHNSKNQSDCKLLLLLISNKKQKIKKHQKIKIVKKKSRIWDNSETWPNSGQSELN